MITLIETSKGDVSRCIHTPIYENSFLATSEHLFFWHLESSLWPVPGRWVRGMNEHVWEKVLPHPPTMGKTSGLEPEAHEIWDGESGGMHGSQYRLHISINWSSLEDADWTYLKSSLFTCLVIDIGCCQGPELGQSAKIPSCSLSTRLLEWWLHSKDKPPKRENEVGSFITFFKLVVASYTELLLQHFIHWKQEEGKWDSTF